MCNPVFAIQCYTANSKIIEQFCVGLICLGGCIFGELFKWRFYDGLPICKYLGFQGFINIIYWYFGLFIISVECLLVQKVSGYITFCQTNIATVINLYRTCSFACVLVSLFYILLQVNELYALLTKTETLAQVLPQTVDRVLAQESLQRQGNTVFCYFVLGGNDNCHKNPPQYSNLSWFKSYSLEYVSGSTCVPFSPGSRQRFLSSSVCSEFF